MGKIIMNGNAYGSVGSDVEANPQGTATDTLDTIGIDNVIYEIQGGGGSSSGVYIEEELYTASSSSFVNITLTKSLLDYDFVIFHLDWDFTTTYNHLNSGFIFTHDQLAERAGDSTNKLIPMIDSSHISRYFLSADGKTLTADTTDNDTAVRTIVGIKTSGDYFSPIIYSTEEREVGVWIDGKPLYQKTFNKMDVVLSDNNWTNNILGTTGITIKQYEGYFALDGYTSLFSYEYYRGSSEYFTANINSSGDINVRPNMNAGADVLAGIITIWYTKNNDVPGSGQYSPRGVPAVHYSTDEQVIGTWIDGKTIYQKTYDLGSDVIIYSGQANDISSYIADIKDNVSNYICCKGHSDSYKGYADFFMDTDGRVCLYTGVSMAIRYLTIQYTKTTS